MSTKTIKRVLEKLERTTKLSAVKTELSAYDDLKTAIDNVYEYEPENLDETINKANDVLALKDVYRDEARYFVEKYEDIDLEMSELKNALDNAQERMDEYIRLSEELGLNPFDKAEVASAQQYIEEMREEYFKYNEAYALIYEVNQSQFEN